VTSLITPVHRVWKASRPDDTQTKQLSKDQYDTEPRPFSAHANCLNFHDLEDTRMGYICVSFHCPVPLCFQNADRPDELRVANKAKVSGLRMKLQQAWDRGCWILKFRHHMPRNIRTIQWLRDCRMDNQNVLALAHYPGAIVEIIDCFYLTDFDYLL
jgi:hypothetical protein